MKLKSSLLRHRLVRSSLATATLACLSLSAGASAIDYFLKIDGIEGESTDDGHDKWIELLYFSQAVVRQGSGDPATPMPDKPDFKEFTVEKELDFSSPKLLEASCRGTVLPSLLLEITRDAPNGKETYYRYELKNVLVTRYSIGRSAGDGVPVESFSLHFEEIQVIHDDGSSSEGGRVEFSWNTVTNKPS